MNLEDELRETMRGHDHEAPTVADLPTRPWSPRRRNWLPLAAAAAVAALVIGVAGALSLGGGSASRPNVQSLPGGGGPPDCPSTYGGAAGQPWVPATANALDSPDSLVPTDTPDAGVVCGYLDGHTLTTSQPLADNSLANVPATLASLPARLSAPAPCTAILRATDGEQYLLGLRYPDGVLWVSIIGDHCHGAGNGQFSTDINLRDSAATAYQTGEWPPALVQHR